MSALGAYLSWGIIPIYWKFLKEVNSFEIFAHRVLWSLVFYFLIMLIVQQWTTFLDFTRNKKALQLSFISSMLLAANWSIYVYAVNSNQIVEGSLGYFLSPLFSIAIGKFLLKEHLSKLQKWSVGLAALGTLWMVLFAQTWPWIALSLGVTFAFYGLLRKKIQAPVSVVCFIETCFMLPLAVPMIFYYRSLEGAVEINLTLGTLLVFSGLITGGPILLFARGAQGLKLASLGVLQYISPSLQFLLGVMLYQEKLNAEKVLAFSAIWIALAIYTYDLLRSSRVAHGLSSPNP